MAATGGITQRQRNGYLTLTLHSAGNNAITSYVTRSSTNSAVAANSTASETVSQMVITKITWALGPSSNCIIRRGGNSVYRCMTNGNEINPQGDCTPLEVSQGDRAANCVIVLNGPGSVIVQLKKTATVSNYNNPQFPNA